MSALDRMRKRLEFHGGITQESRFIKDKERTLKRALLYSYQACTIVLQDDRNFRALMNPNKLKPQYDEKMISIPFKDICLNRPRAGKRSEGEEEIGLKTGDYFVWKETKSSLDSLEGILNPTSFPFLSVQRYCNILTESNSQELYLLPSVSEKAN